MRQNTLFGMCWKKLGWQKPHSRTMRPLKRFTTKTLVPNTPRGLLSRLQNYEWVRWTYTYIGRWFWCCTCFSFWVGQADLIILFNSANFVKCRHPTQWICCKSAHCSYILKNKGGEESIFPMMSSDLLQYEKKWKRHCKWRADKRNCKGKQEQLTHKGCDVYLRSIFVVERYSYDIEPLQWDI